MTTKQEQAKELARQILAREGEKRVRQAPKYEPDRWYGCDMVYGDSYGYSWGIAPETLETVSLGKTEKVKETLASGVIPDNQCPGARLALEDIIQSIKKEEHEGELSAKPRSVGRSLPVRAVGRKQGHTRRPQKHERASLRSGKHEV